MSISKPCLLQGAAFSIWEGKTWLAIIVRSKGGYAPNKLDYRSQSLRLAIVLYQSKAAPTKTDSIMLGTIPTRMIVSIAAAAMPTSEIIMTDTATPRRMSNKMQPTAPPKTAIANAAVPHAGRVLMIS